LLQGSVLSPTLFNLHTADFPRTGARKFIFVDDVSLVAQVKSFLELEDIF